MNSTIAPTKALLVVSAIALAVSLFFWWFINGQIYVECAFGPEFSLLDDNGIAITVLILAVGSSIVGAIVAGWHLFKRKNRFALILMALNIVASPLMFLEVIHTGNTTDYAILSEKK